jgi:hypothetical protein
MIFLPCFSIGKWKAVAREWLPMSLMLTLLTLTVSDLHRAQGACAEYPSPFERPLSRRRMCSAPNLGMRTWAAKSPQTLAYLCGTWAGHGPCVGDSGGPAIATDSRGRTVLLGIASVGTARCVILGCIPWICQVRAGGTARD